MGNNKGKVTITDEMMWTPPTSREAGSKLNETLFHLFKTKSLPYLLEVIVTLHEWVFTSILPSPLPRIVPKGSLVSVGISWVAHGLYQAYCKSVTSYQRCID